MYDASNKSTFDALEHWLDEMKHEMINQCEMDNVTFVVCANKVNI